MSDPLDEWPWNAELDEYDRLLIDAQWEEEYGNGLDQRDND